MGIFGSLKDNISSAAAEKFLAQYIEKYGKLTDFKIHSEQKKIILKIQLLGEVSPIEIYVDNYSLKEQGKRVFIQVNEIRTSREWLNLVLNDYVKGRQFELPESYSGLIKKAL